MPDSGCGKRETLLRKLATWSSTCARACLDWVGFSAAKIRSRSSSARLAMSASIGREPGSPSKSTWKGLKLASIDAPGTSAGGSPALRCDFIAIATAWLAVEPRMRDVADWAFCAASALASWEASDGGADGALRSLVRAVSSLTDSNICLIGDVAAEAALSARYLGLSWTSGRNCKLLSAAFQAARKSLP